MLVFFPHATDSWSPLSSSATPHEIEIGNMFDVDHRRRRLEELRQEEDEAVEEDRRVLFADGGGYMPFTQVDEGSMSYDEVYSEDIFLGRANRVSAFAHVEGAGGGGTCALLAVFVR